MSWGFVFSDWGKTMFGKFSLRDKKASIAFPRMPVLTLIFGGHFSFPAFPPNWPNTQRLSDPGDLSTNGREGRGGK